MEVIFYACKAGRSGDIAGKFSKAWGVQFLFLTKIFGGSQSKIRFLVFPWGLCATF